MTDQSSAGLDLAVGFVDDVIATGEPQTLRLYLSNTGSAPVTLTGSQPWFTLQFIPGATAGALATTSTISAIEVTPVQGNWSVASPTASAPGWRLEPAAGGLAPGATAAFDLANITVAVPGSTHATLTYGGQTATDSGHYTLPINKLVEPPPIPQPQVTSFSVTPAAVTLGPQTNQVTLTFAVTNAQQVYIDGAGYFASASEGSGTVDVTVWRSTNFRLYAIGADGAIATRSAAVQVTPSVNDQVPNQAAFLWNGSTAPSLAGYQPNPWSNAAGKFFVGAGGQFNTGSSGTGDTHTHAVPALGFTTNTTSGHTHGFPHSRDGSTTTGSSSQDGGHGHTLTGAVGGTSGSAAAGKPPWYALAFIIKDY